MLNFISKLIFTLPTVPTQFIDLPRDIQREIFLLCPSDLKQLLFVSRTISMLISPLLFQKCWHYPLTLNEQLNYLRNNPDSFTWFKINTFESSATGIETSASVYSIRDTKEAYRCQKYTIYKQYFERTIFRRFDGSINPKMLRTTLEKSEILFDLKSIYSMVKRRGANSLFDRTYVSNCLKAFISNIDNDKYYNKIIIYLYLMMHVPIFQIDFPTTIITDEHKLTFEEANQIVSNIPIMIELVEKAIANL